MGKILGNLTNAEVQIPGQAPQYSQDQSQLAQSASKSLPSADAMLGPDVLNPASTSQAPMPSKIQKPSFLEATQTGPGGTANAMAPELTTKGKILTALMSGAFGALAGAGQKTVGEGFQQGAQLPFLQTQQRQQAESGALDLQQKKLQNQYFPQILAQNFRAKNAEITKNEGEGAKASAEAGAVPGKTALEQAQTEAAHYKDDPNLGLIDLRTKQPVSDAGFAPLTADEAQVLGKQPGERVPLKVKNTASEITNRGKATVNTEEGVFDYNRNTGSKKKLGNNPRMVFAPENKIIQTADPSKPGETKFTRAGDAVKSGVAGPQSASVQVPKKAELAEVPSKIGDQKVAFNTAIAHADLLRQAAKALQNGDTRTLNGLSNRAQSEFGDSALTDYNAISGAYAREITKMLSAGHMTNDEIGHSSSTLPSNANYATIDKVLGSYQKLAKSKLDNLNLQKKNAINESQGKPDEAPQSHPFFTQFGGTPR